MSETTITPRTAHGSAVSRVDIRERLAYGTGDLATSLILVTAAGFLTYFYTDTIGLSAAAVGSIFAVLKLVDAVIDLGVGALVDRTATRWGKARPWLLWMCVPYALSGFLLFTVPHGSPGLKYAYVAVTYLLMNVFYSAVNVPYGVLNSLVTQHQHERSVLNLFRTAFALGGALLVSYLAIPTVKTFGGGQRGWILTFAVVAVLTVLLWLVTFAFTRERVHAAGPAPKKVPLGPGLRALFRNKYWGLLLILAVINFSYQAIIGGVNVYYVQYVISDLSLIGPLSLAGIVPIILMMFVLGPVVKRLGKRNTAIIGLFIVVAGSLLLAVDPSNVQLAIAAAIIRSIGAAPFMGTFFAMLAETIEYGEWKTGLRTEGLVYSAGSFGTKVGTGLGSAALGWGLALGGYVGGRATIAGSAHTAIVFMAVWLPAVVSLILAGLLALYRLEKQYPAILAELDARRAQETATEA